MVVYHELSKETVGDSLYQESGFPLPRTIYFTQDNLSYTHAGRFILPRTILSHPQQFILPRTIYPTQDNLSYTHAGQSILIRTILSYPGQFYPTQNNTHHFVTQPGF